MASIIQGAKLAVTGEIANRTVGPPHWQQGICSCTEDMGMCCQTICCTPCTASNIMNRREGGSPDFDCVNCVCCLGLTYATENQYPLWLAMALRRGLVQRYGIQDETSCNSCLMGLFCGPCTYCQVQQEMAKRQEHCGGCCANAPQESLMDKAGNFASKAAGEMLHNGIQAPRYWGSGLCDCGGAECAEGFFCPCVVFGYIATRIDSERVTNVSANPQVDPAACCGSLVASVGWVYANRRELIERYNITGESNVMSIIKVMCCTICTTLQQRREMGYAGEWPGSLCVNEAPQKQ